MSISFEMEKLTLISALFCSSKLWAKTFNSRGGGTKDFWYPLSMATLVQCASSDLSSQSLMLLHLLVMGIQTPLAQLNSSPVQYSFASNSLHQFVLNLKKMCEYKLSFTRTQWELRRVLLCAAANVPCHGPGPYPNHQTRKQTYQIQLISIYHIAQWLPTSICYLDRSE